MNAQGNPNAVFIFKTATTLITETASSVNFINGAQPRNVFWKVGSSATLGSASVFAGSILALESISVNNGVTVAGRLLARGGAVTLINDTVTRAPCATTETGGESGGAPVGSSPTSGGVDNSASNTGGGKIGSGSRGSKGGGGSGDAKSRPGPSASITGVPRSRPANPAATSGLVRCLDRGFLAKFRIESPIAMRRVEVFLDGELIERTTRKAFAVRIDVEGLRAGRNTIRIRAVDRNGRVDVASERFRSCAAARPTPSFTG